MQKALSFLFVLLLSCTHLQAQKKLIKTYINETKQEINLAAVNEINLENEFLSHQLYFFGFIHGSVTAQEVDFALLKNLNQQAGIKYYAPEVGPSFAFFLNQYLDTGDQALLKGLTQFYEKRVPQDAGVEWIEKWQKIYELNKSLKAADRIRVIGTDAPIAAKLTLAHLAALVSTKETGNSTLDSLQHFTQLSYEKKSGVWSGKPALDSGKPWSYFFPNPANDYYDKIAEFITENKQQKASKAFDENWEEVQWLVALSEQKGREHIIFENFKKLVLPIIEQGEKVYANFGYFHIQQGLINGNESVAYKLKHKLNKNLSMVSIQGLIAKSTVLKEKRVKKEGEVIIRDVKFTGMAYNGYKHSRSWDGDSFLERAKGINLLKKSLEANATLINLNKQNSPFHNNDHFAAFSRGGKKWKLTPGQHTTDYFQYVVYIQNSNGIRPLEEFDD